MFEAALAMPQPPAYARRFDFTPLAPANVPTSGVRANAEFDALALSVSGIRSNLARIQRDDGVLKNASVHLDSLSAVVRSLLGAGWEPKGAWVTGASYAAKDVVTEASNVYVCLTKHTAGVFATDLAAQKWALLYTTDLLPAEESITPSMLHPDFVLPIGQVVGDVPQARVVGDVPQDKIADLLASGATVALPIGNQLVVNVKSFGAVGDGVTDDAPAIQAAIDALELLGGGEMKVPRGTYRLGSNVRISKSNLRLIGEAGGNQHDALNAAADYCTRFLWGGADGGVMVTVEPDEDALGRRVAGAAVERIALFGDNGTTVAGTGLQVRSCFHCDFDVYVESTTTHGVFVGVVGTLGEARDTQHCQFWIQGKQVNTNSGTILTLDGQQGAIISVEANTSFNVFHDVFGLYKFNTGLLLTNADNNLFLNTRLFRFGGGTGVGVVLCAGVDALRTARANRFYQLSPGTGGVVAEGTEVAVIPSNRNRIDSYDTENTAPPPFYGTGARLFMRDDNGIFDELSVASSQPSVTLLKAASSSSGFAGDLVQTVTDRAASAGFIHMHAQTDAGANNSFVLRGDGNGLCDGAWTGGGADYAEWMEWEDGNPTGEDRRGFPVVFGAGGKVRIATPEDPATTIVGAVSAAPAIVGNGDALQWRGKYLRDDFGSYVLDENGERTPNPDFDPELDYTPREARPEWGLIGLLGRLRLRAGTPRGDRWLRLGDVSAEVEEWLVR
jgi:hypothetical protein